MITKPFNVHTLWKSQMYKSGHIPISIHDEVKEVETKCIKINIKPPQVNEIYHINRLAMSYNDYSEAYWKGVKERQRIYRLEREY